MPGLPVHCRLPEFTQTQSIESVMPSNHLILIESISSISEETSAASSNVTNTAVRQMNSATELAKASSDLATRANELTELLKQFTL